MLRYVVALRARLIPTTTVPLKELPRMDGILGTVATWATDIMEKLGYIGLALLTALENIIPIVPSEVIQPLAGFLAGEGRMNFFLALIAATAGSVGGAVVLYLVGHWFGEWRLRLLVGRWGR